MSRPCDSGPMPSSFVMGIGPFQPPKNKMAASPLTANIEPYSAMKKMLQRKPEYSVRNPATSSLSASARSNGARLQLAVATMKKMKHNVSATMRLRMKSRPDWIPYGWGWLLALQLRFCHF